MSRELKFKLFYIQDNKFWLDGNGWDLYSLACSFREYIGQPDKFRLIQYTGLKDKNGKEIYEGDIVIKHINDTTFPLHPFEVKWNDQHCGYGITVANNHTYEIIGNIYENPELLK